MAERYYSATAQETTLQVGINNSATVIQVAATTGFPVSLPYLLAIDYESATEEVVLVTGAAGTSLTVTRSYDSTSAAAHSAGARVRHVSSAIDFRDSREHEEADQGIHGLAPTDVVVGRDATQTLTNKTLTNPTINSASVSGTIAGPATYTSATLTTPTINGAAISGTVTGSPTFSGSPVFSGSPDFTGSPDWNGATVTGSATLTGSNLFTDDQRWEQANDTDIAIRIGSAGAANKFVVRTDGDLEWGDGTNPPGVVLSHSGGGDATITLSSGNGDFTVAGNFFVTGVGEVQAIRKIANESVTNSITVQDDDELMGAVTSGSTYLFDCWVILSDNTAGADFLANFGGTSTGTIAWSGIGPHNSMTTGSQADGEWIARTSTANTIPFACSQTAGTFVGVRMQGSYACSGSGTFGLRWAQQTASATATTVRAGSWIRIERIQ